FAGGNDGAGPAAPLSLSGDTLFGTTTQGGISNMGTIFSLKTDGTSYVVLHALSPPYDGSSYGQPINEDGANPQCRLLVSSNVIYGAAPSGGRYAYGTVFRLNIDGTGFTNLHSFRYWDSDGAGPINGVVLLENSLYGATGSGGWEVWYSF